MSGADKRTGKTAANRPTRRRPFALPGSETTLAYRWDISTDRLAWGRGAARFFGLPGMARLKTGRAFADWLRGSPGASRAHAILFANETDDGFGVHYRAVYGFARPDGTVLWVEDSGRWFAGRDGRPTRAEGIVRPVAAPEQVAVTPTGGDFLTRLGQDFAALQQSDTTASLMAFAFDPSTEPDGDMLARLRAMVRIGDRAGQVGRLLILFARSCPPEQAQGAATRLAEALSRQTGAPIRTLALRLPADARHPMAAIAQAEHQLLAEETAIADPLARALRAINTRSVTMARQPIVAAGTRQRAFYEALARIGDGQGGFEPTEECISALDAHGSIALLDHRMLSLAIDALEHDPGLALSVNVAPRTLAAADWFRYAEVRLSRRPDLARRLILEVTEQADVAMLTHNQTALAALRAWGVRLAIDDFGMGRTSLRHLTTLRADIVKIAGPFVQNCSRSLEDRQFLGALIDMSRQIGMQTVAEWVEDEASAAFLEQRGIDFMQGRLFGAAELPAAAHAQPGPRRALAV